MKNQGYILPPKVYNSPITKLRDTEMVKMPNNSKVYF
jgi:hypothetical protein